MKILSILVFVLCLVVTMATPATLSKQSISHSQRKLWQGWQCSRRSCPPWKCQDDSAVIHGYCCGCPGSYLDNVPIPCYLLIGELTCPASSEPLCTDYNFMMECCCTGP